MCTMDYYSEFSGNWNGQFVTITKGDIKVPEELEEFIQRPITKVEIEPDIREIYDDNEIRKEFKFKKDTLRQNMNYEFAGEIRAIRNEIPVIEVRIK